VYAEFYLTQVVSHHDLPAVKRLLEAGRRKGLTLPGMFGVFFYRSANPKTLGALKEFLPVPAEALAREFAKGATAEDVCARSVRALIDAGVQHFYISNLPIGRAPLVLADILQRAGVQPRNHEST
jgi:hypothetical protein